MSKIQRIGVLTGGGDCPGLNAVLRGLVKTAAYDHDIQVVGFLDGFAGVLKDRTMRLDGDTVSGILQRGGTILGSSNRDNPFRVPVQVEGERKFEDRSEEAMRIFDRYGLQLLVVVGGDGSLSIALELARKGMPVIGIPKTIDNDLAATDVSFGFDTALTTATEALDKLHTTAQSHHRIMVLEVMGRYAGWIALEAGVAGGGDVILVPEIPFRIESVVGAIKERTFRGRTFTLIVIAEGAKAEGGEVVVSKVVADSTDSIRLGGVGHWLAAELEQRLEREVRVTVLGHLQRGGTPTAFDRILGTRYGVHAAHCAAEGRKEIMVSLQGTEVTEVPLADAVREPRRVAPDSQIVRAARSVGTRFGDE
ncbi:MAG: ATP-dependent 6-phosphofructokinase [Candidatus Eisenbacteria sp.]|nr:ATP-dependent 6-phosphofructokinase [Candidatus Eisenbacteria bacterium]